MTYSNDPKCRQIIEAGKKQPPQTAPITSPAPRTKLPAKPKAAPAQPIRKQAARPQAAPARSVKHEFDIPKAGARRRELGKKVNPTEAELREYRDLSNQIEEEIDKRQRKINSDMSKA